MDQVFHVSFDMLTSIYGTHCINKILIFLNDWKSGHYFELDRTPIVNWNKGDYYFWQEDAPHMAANLGVENRYTMQVTVVL